MIIGLGAASSATHFYSWTGSLQVGQTVYVNNIPLTVDQDNTTGKLALILPHGLLFDGQNTTYEGLEISFYAINKQGVIGISSDKPFTINFAKEDYAEKIQQLEQENAALKAQNANLSQKINSLEAQVQKLQNENAKLKKQAPSTADVQKLNAKLVNLTKQNMKLKAELANITNKYNTLQAKASFLEQQNDEYRQIIQQVMNEQSSQSKQTYIQKAEKERLIGSVLLKSIFFGLGVVAVIGYGLYRVKRKHEYVRL